jgi:hypothetical protein
MRTKTLLVCGLVGVALACGCSGSTVANPTGKGLLARSIERAKYSGYFNNIRHAYVSCDTSDGHGPVDLERLKPELENNRAICDAIQNGQIVVIWGVSLRNTPGNTILAYEKDADANGKRFVLLAGGSIQEMQDQEFQTTPKAQGK